MHSLNGFVVVLHFAEKTQVMLLNGGQRFSLMLREGGDV